MPAFHRMGGLRKHGYKLEDVREWRRAEHEARRASGYDEFFRAHGLCVDCGGEGRLVTGVRWRDSDGVERAEAGSVAALVERHNLENSVNWLNDTSKWGYLYETCGVCEGTGKSKGP